MSNFHKPKIYRSAHGCCICRAKSSSSRFTDSTRYEHDFEQCFLTSDHRSGEICNACVLLVKRYKKLPSGSSRNWHHVVDARSGPGTKSILKIKSKNQEEKKLYKKKHRYQRQHQRLRQPPSPGGLSDDVLIGYDDNSSVGSESEEECFSPAYSPRATTVQSTRTTRSSSRRMKVKPRKCSSFLDLSYWKRSEVCCGTIFKGVNGEVLLDMSLMHPCRSCKLPTLEQPETYTAQPEPASYVPDTPPGSVCSSDEIQTTTADMDIDVPPVLTAVGVAAYAGSCVQPLLSDEDSHSSLHSSTHSSTHSDIVSLETNSGALDLSHTNSSAMNLCNSILDLSMSTADKHATSQAHIPQPPVCIEV